MDQKMQDAKIVMPEKKSKVFLFFDNFFYHYKWYVAIVLVLAIFITVCAVQCAKKENYDAYLIYAGGAEISGLRGGEIESPFEKAAAALRKYAPDADGDGQKTVSLDTYLILSNEEAAALGDKVNATRLAEDRNTFADSLTVGETYVYILSKEVYDYYKASLGAELFAPLSPYAGENVLYYDDSAVYLSSTALGAEPVFCDLPEGTVICLRDLSEVSRTFAKKKNQKNFGKAEEFLRNLLQ